MAARISACVLVLVAAHALAHADDEVTAIVGRDPGWRIEEVELRTSYLAQRGHGYQSQAGAPGEPGSEAMWVLEPWARLRVRQSARVDHEVTIPVDVISAASPDAVDATSGASRHNEAVDVDVRTRYQRTEHDTVLVRLAAHVEEPVKSRTAGVGWRRSLADDNATLTVNGALTFDGFDNRDHHGAYLGPAARWTANANVALAQLLSPTTVVDGSYGITQQVGMLSEGWNAVPTASGPTNERLPHGRLRQALAVRLAQHLPQTRSTAKLAYRLYLDNFGVTAHTIEAAAYQYVTAWLYLRGAYRFHHQNGVAFFTPMSLATPLDDAVLRTADSDLAPLDAHEWSVQLVTLPRRDHRWSLSGELLRYTRSNDLQVMAVALGLVVPL